MCINCWFLKLNQWQRNGQEADGKWQNGCDWRKKPIKTFDTLKWPYAPSICIKQHDDFKTKNHRHRIYVHGTGSCNCKPHFCKATALPECHAEHCHRYQWAPTFSLHHTGSCAFSPVLSMHSVLHVSYSQPLRITRFTTVCKATLVSKHCNIIYVHIYFLTSTVYMRK
jgi:hypothetical protein